MSKKLTSKILKLKMNIDNDVLLELEKEADKLLIKLKNLKKINVENIMPMTRIDETPIPITQLRNDIPKNTFFKKKFLKNANNHNGDFIIIKKVIKND